MGALVALGIRALDPTGRVAHLRLGVQLGVSADDLGLIGPLTRRPALALRRLRGGLAGDAASASVQRAALLPSAAPSAGGLGALDCSSLLALLPLVG